MTSGIQPPSGDAVLMAKAIDAVSKVYDGATNALNGGKVSADKNSGFERDFKVAYDTLVRGQITPNNGLNSTANYVFKNGAQALYSIGAEANTSPSGYSLTQVAQSTGNILLGLGVSKENLVARATPQTAQSGTFELSPGVTGGATTTPGITSQVSTPATTFQLSPGTTSSPSSGSGNVDSLIQQALSAVTSDKKADFLGQAADAFKASLSSGVSAPALTTAPTLSQPTSVGSYQPSVTSTPSAGETSPPPPPPAPVNVTKTYSADDLVGMSQATGGRLYADDGRLAIDGGKGDTDKDEVGGKAGESLTITMPPNTTAAQIEIGKFNPGERNGDERLQATLTFADGSTKSVEVSAGQLNGGRLDLSGDGKAIASVKLEAVGKGSEFSVNGMQTTETQNLPSGATGTVAPTTSSSSSGGGQSAGVGLSDQQKAGMADLIKTLGAIVNQSSVLGEDSQNRILDQLTRGLGALKNITAEATPQNVENVKRFLDEMAPILDNKQVLGAISGLPGGADALKGLNQALQTLAAGGTPTVANAGGFAATPEAAAALNNALAGLAPQIKTLDLPDAQKLNALELIGSISQLAGQAATGGGTVESRAQLADAVSDLMGLIKAGSGQRTDLNGALDNLSNAFKALTGTSVAPNPVSIELPVDTRNVG